MTNSCPTPEPTLCIDCGAPTFCGVPHGAGHDHSEQARSCSEAALAEATAV